MQREALFLSVRPTFVDRLLDGTKTVELRRVRPTAHVGQRVLIYGSSPKKSLMAWAIIDNLEYGPVQDMWRRVCDSAGISRSQYASYFEGARTASAIWLRSVTPFDRPLALCDLRERWPWFRPPQSYCFIQATFEGPGTGGLASLAPRLEVPRPSLATSPFQARLL